MTQQPNLKHYRELANLTQADLAKAANIAQPSLCQYETGARNPSMGTAKSIVLALRSFNVDCSIDDCFPI